MQHARHLLCVAAVALSALSACNEVMAYQGMMQINDIKMNIAQSPSQARMRRCEASRGLHANLLYLRHKKHFPGMSIQLQSMSYVKAPTGASVEMRAAEKKPDTSPPLSQTINKPPVSIEEGGYRAPDELRTWKDFSYCAPEVRREVAARYAASMRARSKEEQRLAGLQIDDDFIKVPTIPPMKIVLIGGPCAGKGTIAPMISQAFRTRVVGVGQLLRGEIRAGTPRGREAAAIMERGDLLDDELVVSLLSSRLSGSWDAMQNGFMLDGFPRSTKQAVSADSEAAQQAAIICAQGSPAGQALRPDCVIVLERPDELVKEFALGRMTDSATGQTYHPLYAPAPADVRPRLVWRLDDTPHVVEKRCKAFRESVREILDEFAKAGVPIKVVDNARSEVETFAEVAQMLEDTARHKLRESGGWSATCRQILCDLENVAIPLADQDDVLPVCDLTDEGESECLVRWGQDRKEPLLDIVRRCNSFDEKDYIPVLVENHQVGWTSVKMVEELAGYIANGIACELVRLRADDADTGGNKAALSCWGSVTSAGGEVREGLLEIGGHRVALRLAPNNKHGYGYGSGSKAAGTPATPADRSARLALFVQELVADGVIPGKAVRNQLQAVRSIKSLGGSGELPALLHLERAAMIYFGIPSFGVHVNGFVRDPVTKRAAAVWIAKRSMSKATYPGLLDQMVAGAQPSGMSYKENVVSKALLEASLSPEIVSNMICTGMVSYKYSTRKGLSTKVLATFDVEMPQGLSPVCSDGEVEEFTLMTVEEAVKSLREKLPLWKPNSALIMLDFAVRHGYIDPDEPGYGEFCHLLRGGLRFSK